MGVRVGPGWTAPSSVLISLHSVTDKGTHATQTLGKSVFVGGRGSHVFIVGS